MLSLQGTSPDTESDQTLEDVIADHSVEVLEELALRRERALALHEEVQAVYAGLRSNFTIVQDTTAGTITVSSAALGTDTLTGIERLSFGDKTLKCKLLDTYDFSDTDICLMSAGGSSSA